MTHIPVLLNETLELLNPKSGEFIIDGTVNGGGHARAIIKRIEDGGIFLGVDWDKDILEKTRGEFEKEFRESKCKIILQNASYTELPNILKEKDLPLADGLLLDLGFSSEHLISQKGFSYRLMSGVDEPLDMRYDRSGDRPTAAAIINSLREEELADIIFRYGEERFSRKIAGAIVKARKEKRIVSVSDLVEVIKKGVPAFFKKGEQDVISRTFQAIRIYVNEEFWNIESAMNDIEKIVKPDGRVLIITFHSLEDRIIKNKFREMEREGIGKVITKRPVEPSEEEIARNPRSRSAKLRAIRLIKNENYK